TYAIYGFLAHFANLSRSVIIKRLINTGIRDGSINLDKVFSGGVNGFLDDMSSIYMDVLPDVFGSRNIITSKSELSVEINDADFDYLSFEMQRLVNPRSRARDGAVNIVKLPGSNIIEFVVESTIIEKLEIRSFAAFITESLVSNVISKISPTVYVASAERTGAAIFRDELDFAKLRLFDLLKSKNEKQDISDALMSEAFGGNYSYAWPIEHNVDFVRKIESIYKDSSELCNLNPDIIEKFENIIGGSYKVVKDVLVYQSNSSGKPRFAMSESSSSVRALLDIGFYIRCKLKRGDILMIDEPELNLHPKNQRLVARLLAALVNCGVKVFITTHSDYIIKELNILMMLKSSSQSDIVAKKYGYSPSEFVDYNSMSVYVTGKKKISRRKINTLEKAKITKEFGIELPTFDNSIEEMADIQSDLFFGGE
ncbi:AAA family ATPase, partial [Klebsiella pneumoniae]|uniref:AAA family ATPase n=1 Tax=Klebsiella pneumoniae TaxID=573 RepID=UPI003D0BBFF7